MTDWPFGKLQMFGYQMIMADPPWSFDNYSIKGEAKNPKAHYNCMSLDDIKALRVGDLAGDHCVLWLWACNPMLDQAIEVMQAWGFIFKTAGTWLKTTKHGKISFGPGYILRSSNEPFLIGTVGRPVTTNAVRSGFAARVREHSRKPDHAYRMAEALIPNARRADLFSRQTRPGWESWGNESTKFDLDQIESLRQA